MKVLMPDGSEFKDTTERTTNVTVKEVRINGVDGIEFHDDPLPHPAQQPPRTLAGASDPESPIKRTRTMIAMELDDWENDLLGAQRRVAALKLELRNFDRKPRTKKATP